MKRLAILSALLAVAVSGAGAAQNYGSVGAGHGIQVPGGDTNPCNGTLSLNYDGTAENGYCWQYGGIVPPYYGAFAECYSINCVCGIELFLTGIGAPCNVFDAYVWEDAGGMPGNVLVTTSGNNPCPVATWPSISVHDFAIPATPVSGTAWVGYWANNANQVCGYFVAADTDGFGGCPFTNIAPGIGYPTGWQNVSVVWGPTQAIGIGGWLATGPQCIPPPPPPTPTTPLSWGQIKQIYK